MVYRGPDRLLCKTVALKIFWEQASTSDPAFERVRREIAASRMALEEALKIYPHGANAERARRILRN